MHIDAMLVMENATQLDDKRWRYSGKTIPLVWSQGRTAYGGVSSGMILAAMLNHITPKDLLRSYTTNFIGPVMLDELVEVDIEVLRQGKNVIQILGKIVQNNNVCVLCQAVFGSARQSKISVPNTDSHQMPIPKKGNFIPQIPKVTPKFLRHFELNIEQGGIPFTRKSTSHYHGWMKYKHAPKLFTLAHLVSIIDAWPPTVLQMLNWPAPASTVSWHIDVLDPTNNIAVDGWLGYQCDTRQAKDGYSHTEAVIYDQNNKAIALSRQTVTVFA